MKIENWCKPDGVKHLGSDKSYFEDELAGEILPCPICGRIPVPMVRHDGIWRGKKQFFAAVSCFGGGGTSHAYVSAKGSGKYTDILQKAVSDWNAGDIDYYERYDNIFRACYTCSSFHKEKGAISGECRKGHSEKPYRSCKDYDRISHEEFMGILTR